MKSACVGCFVVGAVGLASVAFAAPQTTDLVKPPVNILLPNYNTVPVGPNAGLEGAYVARVGDPSAGWINPAGLSRGQQTELSGSSGLYELATVTPTGFPNSGGSFDSIPSLAGVTVPKRIGGRWTLGLVVLTPNWWAQGTDSQTMQDQTDSRIRFAYSSDAHYEQLVIAGAAGAAWGQWRIGGSLALTETNISRNGVVSDRIATDTGLTSVLIESRASGNAVQIRPVAGLQYDASKHILLGATVRTPAITILRGGSYTADAVAAGTSDQGLSFFDPNASFAYHFPFEIHGGIAYVAPRIEIELDVHGFTGVAQYAMLSSSQPIITYAEGPPGSPASIGTQPFSGFTSESRAVINASTGGHVSLTADGRWRVHFGIATDRSPVGAAEQVFTRVNLYGATLGISGTKGGFQFTLGANYRAGSSSDFAVRPLPGIGVIPPGLRVETLGLIYAISYKF
jgi:hypothetical protein